MVTTLFVGTGSALANGDTVFVYEKVSGLEGEWTDGTNRIYAQSQNGFGYFADESIPEGWYANDNIKIYVRSPAATITGTATYGLQQYAVMNGGTLYKGDEVTFISSSLSNNVDVVGFLVTYPNGAAFENFGMGDTSSIDTITISTETLQNGKYTIQAIFDKNDFISETPSNYLISKLLYSFTIMEEPGVTISTNVDSIVEGGTVILTITGKPFSKYTIIPGTYFEIIPNQVNLIGNEISIQANGKVTVALKAIDKGVGKISIEDTDKYVNIKVLEPTITAHTDKESFAIGENVILSGTYTSNSPLYFYIEGNGREFTTLSTPISPNSDNTWSKTITHSELFEGEISAGSYTIYVSTISDATSKEMLGVYNTVTLQMIEPVFKFTNVPAVATQGYSYNVEGVAEVADDVQLYIFGNDFFTFARYNHQTIGDLSGNILSIANGVFDIEFGVTTDKMPTGQYTMIVQHPREDKVFNVYADEQLNVLNDDGAILFNINDRDDPAKTLEEVFTTQNIDDTYIKTTFTVGTPSFSINTHPSEITKGSKLTISGNTPLSEGTTVNVELTKSSTSSITLTTKTDDYGNWEVTFDSTVLDLGEYTIRVRIGISDPIISRVTIIEGQTPDKTKDTINLYTGWNFISIPKYLSTSCEIAGDLFANIDTGGNAILGYDGKTGWYQILADTKIEPLNGYFVYVTNPTILTFTYSTNIKNTPPTKQVYSGWNAVGLSAKDSLSAKSTFAGLDWNRYLPWVMREGVLGNPIINGGSTLNSEEKLVYVKEGGWLYLKADGVYVGNTA